MGSFEERKHQSDMKLEAAGTVCKEHPNDKQLPGVCSYCLRDKLSKLSSNNKPTYHITHFSSNSHHSFSSASSNYESRARRHHHHRHTSSVMDSSSSMTSFRYGLVKSKSIAFAPGSQHRDRELIGDNNGSKKGSFWSKLLKLTRKDTHESFTHSRTMRERRG